MARVHRHGIVGPTVEFRRIDFFFARAGGDGRERRTGGQSIDQRAHWDRHNFVRTGLARAFLGSATIAIFRADMRLVKERGERVDVRIRAEHHIAALPAVAAVRPAFGHEGFAAEAAGAVAAIAGFGVDANVINEH